jgi:hypothetical protein
VIVPNNVYSVYQLRLDPHTGKKIRGHRMFTCKSKSINVQERHLLNAEPLHLMCLQRFMIQELINISKLTSSDSIDLVCVYVAAAIDLMLMSIPQVGINPQSIY